MNKEELKQHILNKPIPKSIAIIMDGNGRWAKSKGMPRTYGHAQGIKTLVEIAEACQDIGVKNLFVYAFSTENWNRPKEEVSFLMQALIDSLSKYKRRIINSQNRIKIIGERDNLSKGVLSAINEIEEATKDFNKSTLYICFNYGGQLEIVHAAKVLAKKVKDGTIDIDDINKESFEAELYTADSEPIDLLIRTSGEMRTSNFLPWQLAYSEFVFTNTYWPDFHEEELYKAIDEYQSRSRRFGGLEDKNVK